MFFLYFESSLGVFNNGLCPNWHYAGKDDPDCGRLPWLFNVEAAHYESKIMIKIIVYLFCYHSHWVRSVSQKILIFVAILINFSLKNTRIVLNSEAFLVY